MRRPKTYNEKLQWLKLYDRNKHYITCVDKYEVRDFIKDSIGEKYLIPLIGIYNTVEEIPWGELPDKFVLKCTHGSGTNIICKDKSRLDIEASKKKLERWMKKNWFWYGREWPYKNVVPRILCEKYMVDESGTKLKDYKLMCFNSEPKIIQVMTERTKEHYFLNHFDLDWNEIDIPRKSVKRNLNIPPKPHGLDKMIAISKILSKGKPFVRIDLYDTKIGVFFGEMTFFPMSGYMDFADDQYDYLLGSWIELPSIINCQKEVKGGTI